MGRLLTANDVPGRYPESYYAATANPTEPFAHLDGDVSCDVCVVGGGYTGLSAALHLAQRGYDTVLVEAHRAGWGASGRNGGQVGTGQRRDQDELENRLGVPHARELWDLAEAAKALVRTLVADHAIACDLKPGIIHADHRERFVADSHRYAEKLRREYGYDLIEPLTRADIQDHLGTGYYHGGTLDRGAAHLHPLNFALGIASAARAAGAKVFERSEVLGYERGPRVRVRLDRGRVTADYLVLACNGYLDDLEDRVAARVMPINNFIIATEPLSEDQARDLIRDDVAVADSKFVINYYRLSADRRMLFGGGENYGYRFPKDIKAFVRPHMLEVYPQLEGAAVEYGWGGTLAVTAKRLPYFVRLSDNVLSASGYSGQGVALATLAGQLLAEAIAGNGERFDIMARIPSIPFPGGKHLRSPMLVLAMTYYALRDRL